MCQYDYDLEFMKGSKRVLSIHLCQLTLKKGRDLDVEMIEFLKNKLIELEDKEDQYYQKSLSLIENISSLNENVSLERLPESNKF
jgi:hypothetical protein